MLFIWANLKVRINYNHFLFFKRHPIATITPNKSMKIPNKKLSDINCMFFTANPLKAPEPPKNVRSTKNNIAIVRMVNIALFSINLSIFLYIKIFLYLKNGAAWAYFDSFACYFHRKYSFCVFGSPHFKYF